MPRSGTVAESNWTMWLLQVWNWFPGRIRKGLECYKQGSIDHEAGRPERGEKVSERNKNSMRNWAKREPFMLFSDKECVWLDPCSSEKLSVEKLKRNGPACCEGSPTTG